MHVQTLCLAKLNATLPEEEIQSCYYLKDGNIKLTLANLSLTSAFNKMVKNPDAEREKTNLYFNFMVSEALLCFVFGQRKFQDCTRS